MSKLLKTLTTLILALCVSVFFVACNDDDASDAGDATTGDLVYELVTGERTVNEGTENEITEEYEYYKITGYTVTSADAIKMANGDFSTVKGKREITIPATYKDKPVEEIGASAFADRIILTKVTFDAGNNIKTIGADAFSGCTNLESIENLPFVGKSADAVGEERMLGYVFGSSTTLTAVTEVSAKAYDELTTTDLKFKFPTSLKKITVSADKIPECAFYGMTMLEDVQFANAVTVGASAFYGCSKLVEVKMPSVEIVYDNAFAGCTALQRINFTDNTVLKFIGDGAFNGCTYLGYNYVTDAEATVKVVIPDTVTYLGSNAFKGCSLLKYVELGTGVADIKTGAFADCTELLKVSASNSELKVKVSAFAGCKKDNLKLYVAGVETSVSDLAFGEYVA